MAKRKKRVKKTPLQRLQDCETHIYFLWDACRQYREQPERYKQVAAELRILVCKTKANKPLLLDLMDEYGFAYEVPPLGASPDGPPLKPGPLPMVGWRDDPVRNRLSKELMEALKSGDEEKMAAVEKKMEELAVPVPFREWVDNGLALFIAPHDYSNRDLALAIAQQSGSSHEDDAVEEPIVRLKEIRILGETADIAGLMNFAGLVVAVGRMFLGHMVQQHGYEPKHFSLPAEEAPDEDSAEPPPPTA